MQFIRNLNIGKKMGLGFGIVTVLMLALIGLSLLRMLSISSAVEIQNEIHFKKLDPLYVAREALAQTGLAARNAYVFKDEGSAKKELIILDEQKAIYLKALKQLEAEFQGDADFAKVKTGLLSMAQELERPRTYREKGDLAGFGEFLVNECSPLRRQIVMDIDVVLKKVQEESAAATNSSNTVLSDSLIEILAGAGVVFLLMIIIAVIITRALLAQLGGEPSYAVGVAEKIAKGDLSTEIETKQSDTGSLLYAIKAMRDNLAVIVSQVRTGADMITESSSDIAAGNMDLSERTEQQASALEKTNAEMRKLTDTVRQNADSAHQANALAVSASNIASQGGEMVEKVIETMNSIDGSSRKIVEIITVIDSIAFQTNILALNAAVEAARAGEQGRGFAVVATEVRNLAQRSATAAKEIKDLIEDSVSKVRAGSNLVQQTGKTMKDVVESVCSVTSVVSEISIASQEQSAGINAVSATVMQMDNATQQNAALVEEAAAAAQSMHDQTGKLSALVRTFTLPDAQNIKIKNVLLSEEGEHETLLLPNRIAA